MSCVVDYAVSVAQERRGDKGPHNGPRWGPARARNIYYPSQVRLRERCELTPLSTEHSTEVVGKSQLLKHSPRLTAKLLTQ
jgi:hypothetical protein